jgi:hypothetical protein
VQLQAGEVGVARLDLFLDEALAILRETVKVALIAPALHHALLIDHHDGQKLPYQRPPKACMPADALALFIDERDLVQRHS